MQISVDLPDTATELEITDALKRVDASVFKSVQLTNERQIAELNYFAEIRERSKAAEQRHKEAFKDVKRK